MLLRILCPASPPQIRCSRGVGVEYKFVMRSTITGGESGLNLRANIFGASDESDVLQDKRLKMITRSEFHFRLVPEDTVHKGTECK